MNTRRKSGMTKRVSPASGAKKTVSAISGVALVGLVTGFQMATAQEMSPSGSVPSSTNNASSSQSSTPAPLENNVVVEAPSTGQSEQPASTPTQQQPAPAAPAPVVEQPAPAAPAPVAPAPVNGTTGGSG